MFDNLQDGDMFREAITDIFKLIHEKTLNFINIQLVA